MNIAEPSPGERRHRQEEEGHAPQGDPEVPLEERLETPVVGPRRDAGLDARGDEGHQAQERRFPDREGLIDKAVDARTVVDASFVK